MTHMPATGNAAAPAGPRAAGPGPSRWTSARRGVFDAVRPTAGALLVLAVLVIVLGSLESTFLTWGNIKNVLVTNASLLIVSVGMTFVMITAGFDLSVGALMAGAQELLYLMLAHGVPAPLALLSVLVAGFVVGALVNGTLIGVFGLNFFVVTLGSMTLIYGIVDVVSNGATSVISAPLVYNVGNASWLGIPMPIIIMAVAFAAGWLVLRFTAFGRVLYGVGGNREAARISGIRVEWVTVLVYGVSGLMAAIAGVMEAGRLSAASPTIGTQIALISGAAVLLGGTSLFGGVGGMFGTLVGVLVIGVLGDGVDLLQVSNFWQGVVTGAVLLGAIMLARAQRLRVS